MEIDLWKHFESLYNKNTNWATELIKKPKDSSWPTYMGGITFQRSIYDRFPLKLGCVKNSSHWGYIGFPLKIPKNKNEQENLLKLLRFYQQLDFKENTSFLAYVYESEENLRATFNEEPIICERHSTRNL